jgi:glycosyltransferase involved in cell wall biosynthesis
MKRLDTASTQQKVVRNRGIPQQYPKIAYILNSFPALSETFIVQEILELERQGLSLHLFSLAQPPAEKNVRVQWEGRSPLTYLAYRSKFALLASAGRHLLVTPLLCLRFLRAFLLMSVHYGLRNAGKSLIYAAHLARLLEPEKIRHLHAHYATEPAAVAQALYMLTGITYSFTAHAYDIYISNKKSLKYKMLMAQFIVTCTAYNQQYLKDIYSTNKRIHCIYHGLNLHAFSVPDLRSTSSSPSTPCILVVGRLLEKKGLSYLVQACGILKNRGYRFAVRIVGEGPLRLSLEQEIHMLGLSECISLLGAATHKDVVEMYRQATLFALPCIIGKDGDRDGIPNVLVEALYMGLPVVSTPISGIPELITTEINGLLVPPRDSNALADALARLIDDPELRNCLAMAGRQTVLERFDMARNVTSLLHLLYGAKDPQTNAEK